MNNCPDCGAVLSGARCLHCERDRSSRLVHREVVVLTILVLIAVVAFAATRRFAASNDDMRRQDAKAWFAAGEAALARRDLDAAATALRRAAARDPGERAYRLALARTLTSAQRDDPARQLLVDLRAEQPEDPDTNLQLARLEARRGDRVSAGRYFETAITGLWRPEQADAQRRVRTEFVQFLLQRDERDRALAELLVLSANVPDDASIESETAALLLAAGDARRANDLFGRALGQTPNDPRTLAGAADAAFALRDYPLTTRYLDAIASDTAHTAVLRQLVDLVVQYDPLTPGLAIAERRRRLALGTSRLIQRFEACRDASPAMDTAAIDAALTTMREADAGAKRPPSPNDTERIERGVAQIWNGERVADQWCGAPEPLDHALQLVAERHGLAER